MKARHIPIDDLNAVAQKHLNLQKPRNVHFSDEGYKVLAQAVTASVKAQLAPTSSSRADTEFLPKQDALPVKPPKDAVLLFDGEAKNLFLSKDGKPCDWKVEQGELVATGNKHRSNHAVSQLHFRDADIHVEFNIDPKAHGNSGVYLHGHYEMQIYNSFGKKSPDEHDEGALYGFEKPLVNAARRPGEWQVYDIRFRAPRRDNDGKIVEQGEVTAWLNGQKVQDRTKFGEPRSAFHPFKYDTTPYLTKIAERQQKTAVGPLFLQDHDSPCRFRNIWVVPLDNQSLLYEPK